jgi:hypothetical protein
LRFSAPLAAKNIDIVLSTYRLIEEIQKRSELMSIQ